MKRADMALASVILAAGKGTRMRSDLPKVLHPIAHAPMLHHVMAASDTLSPDRTLVVAGHQADLVTDVARSFNPGVEVVLQTEQLGTGHAVDQARAALDGFDGNVVVLFGDSPLFQPETLTRLVDALSHADVVCLGFEARDPARYGRLIVKDGVLEKIVEFKDANDAERAVTLCNSGVMAAPAAIMFDLLGKLESGNAAGEYYLTDIIAHARAAGLNTAVSRCPEVETLGVNSRSELAQAERIYQDRRRADLLDQGVTMSAPDTVHFAADTQIGEDCTIEPYVVFGPKVSVAKGATIRAFSHLEGATVGPNATVGPYARLRPGADLQEGTRVGNFVEIKAATVEAGAKVNHLSYIGDARIGPRANIGAGVITCNYDGVGKHKTDVGADAFIGSNTMLVAPVCVGVHAMTASGSVITRDVPASDLAIARAKQDNKAGFGKRLMDRLKAAKKKKDT